MYPNSHKFSVYHNPLFIATCKIEAKPIDSKYETIHCKKMKKVRSGGDEYTYAMTASMFMGKAHGYKA